MTTSLKPLPPVPAPAGSRSASVPRSDASVPRRAASVTLPGVAVPDLTTPPAGTGLDDPASIADPAASVALDAASVPPGSASVAPEDGPGRKTKITLGVFAVLGGIAMGIAGFYLSFGNLSKAGHTVFGFTEDDAQIFAFAVDVSIITCLVVDLFMAAIRTGWPLLRLLAHLLTGASIYFNAAANGAILDHLNKAAAHALMPALFVIITEAGRRVLVHQAALPADHDVIPAHRWLLALGTTWRIFKAMKLWELGYGEAMDQQRDRAIFDAWNAYKAELLAADLEEGSEEALARLPERLAPFGLTVDEALALPDRMAREELRREMEADRRARELELDKERAAHQAQKERLAHRKEMAALTADLTATEGVAGAHARGAIAEAEALAQAQVRTATALSDATESLDAAEAKRRATEALARAAEAEAEGAEAERAATEARRLAAEAEAEENRLRRRAAEDEAARARAVQAAAEAEQRAAEARRLAAEAERAALEAEDEAKLSGPERAARKVARLILARGGDVNTVPLDEVGELLRLKPATASERRHQAAELIAAGYRG
ncbi:DUF2637 domain-containing protein [Streptomyces sp. NPDC060005]|uniref:DUF2637 domain-containing protein n=1 Tax=Streptomyces sp. NPDC060005 TaxID=3347034 RepID=UPI0036A85FD3